MGYPADSTPTWKYSYQAIHALRPLFCSLQVTGVEHVPRQGGVVLACNHPGGLDSFVLGYASSRQVYYMAKRELFNVHPLVTRFLHGIGRISYQQGRPRYGRTRTQCESLAGRACTWHVS